MVFLDAIDHVQLAMPPGGEEQAAWFYGEVLGVPEVPKPPHLAIRGGRWFEQGVVRIHLGVQEDFVPATKAHPAFAVSDLDRLEASMEAHGVDVRREIDADGAVQLYVSDPFGNRLEFRPPRPIAPMADYTSIIEQVATDTLGDRFAAQVMFVQELDRLKSVERQSWILGGLRRENTAEHSWHVALLAAVLADRAGEDIDLGRVILLLLVHDIVEIDAGDTGIYDTRAKESKAERERTAADRLFGSLPDDLGQPLREAWDEYESGDSPEGRFARVFDRLSPFLLNLSASGLAWQRWDVTADRVRHVLSPIRDGSPDIWQFVEAMLHRAITDGLLPAGPAGDDETTAI